MPAVISAIPTWTRALLCLLLLGSAEVRAADMPQLYRYGFSSSGQHHLLLTAWQQDGSGWAAAALRVVRQGGGLTLSDDLRAVQGATPEQVAERLLQRHAAELRDLGLDRPVPGVPLWWSAASPRLAPGGWPERTGQQVTLPALPGAPGAAVTSLALDSVPVTNYCTYAGLIPGGQPEGFSLRVNGREWFRDGLVLPEHRRCAARYRLEGAWQYGDAVAVLVRSYQPGFEGADAVPLTLLGRVTAAKVPALVPVPVPRPAALSR